MFSIIIPLYNKSQHIEKCLNSVFNQTFGGFELLIVNDGSTDESEEKIEGIFKEGLIKGKKYHQFYFRNISVKLISQENLGVSVARNNGVKEAKFNYLAFLDADDWWDSHFLEEMKILIEGYPKAALFGCDYFYVKNGRERTSGVLTDNKKGYIDYIKTYGSKFIVPINCSFVVVRKKEFNEIGGFNPALKYGEDVDLWIRLALKYKVAYINRPLAWSNQDAEPGNRAVGNSHLIPPENHFIFNLEFLSSEEKVNAGLKNLLDGLRVRSLLKFYLSNKYPVKVKKELAKVDLNKQPVYYRFIYILPKWMVKLYFFSRGKGSAIKKFFLNKILWSKTEQESI